jgi:hypothetical protein
MRVSARVFLLGTFAVAGACNGRWSMAMPPDTGVPAPRTAAARGAHRHVHVPGEVRGERLGPVFARSVASTVYRDGQWLFDSVTTDSVITALVALAPTHVSSLFRFAAGERPTPRHLAVWQRARERVARAQPDVRFDVALDALAYSSGPEVVAHLRLLDDLLAPDLWYFVAWDDAERQAFDVVASATSQVHANGQPIGGLTRGNEIATDSDFGVLTARGDARAIARQLSALRQYHDLPYLVLRTPGSAGGSLTTTTRCHYTWRLVLGGGPTGFAPTALADSLRLAAPCRRDAPPPR